VVAGDTIWLRGGTYAGTYISYLNGTSTSPVILRQYPGERATIDGGNSNGQPVFDVWGNYVWFWGLEFTSSDPVRQTQQSGPFPTDILRGAVDIHNATGYGIGVKFINCVLHDLRGAGMPTPALDMEYNGCLLYYSGWDAPDGGHGHALYVQNLTGTKHIVDNIIFEQFSHGIHAYTEGSFIDNIELRGNTVFNNGSLSTRGPARNVLIGGLVVTHNPSVVENSMYYPNAGQPASSFYLGYTTGCVNATVTDNYLANNVFFPNCRPASMSGNTIYGSLTGFTASQFSNNTYDSSRPTGVKVFVRPNQYEPGRANVTVFNWDLENAVIVDLSSVLSLGAEFEVRNAQDFFGAPVVTGVYDGKPVSLPMTGLSVAQPVGWNAPPPSGPEFNVFVVLTHAYVREAPELPRAPSPAPRLLNRPGTEHGWRPEHAAP
jgi:hypothetical protein